MATAKQIGLVKYLLDKNGFDTRRLDSSFKRLGANMRERSMTVDSWLEDKNNREISSIIDRLNE